MDDRVLRSMGAPIDDTYTRDAVHIAVIPAVAGQALKAGDRVYLDRNRAARLATDGAIGVVDPFLRFPVRMGQMVWVFLMPGSITSLRHEWTHPDLPEDAAKDSSTPALSQSRRDAAEARLRGLADDAGISYGDLLDGMEDHSKGGDWIHLGTDTPDVYDRVWDDYELVTGKPRLQGEDHFFSCSC